MMFVGELYPCSTEFPHYFYRKQPRGWEFFIPGLVRGASLDGGAHPGLHWKPLDATIGQVPVSYCHGSCRDWQICWKHTKHQLNTTSSHAPCPFPNLQMQHNGREVWFWLRKVYYCELVDKGLLGAPTWILWDLEMSLTEDDLAGYFYRDYLSIWWSKHVRRNAQSCIGTSSPALRRSCGNTPPQYLPRSD